MNLFTNIFLNKCFISFTIFKITFAVFILVNMAAVGRNIFLNSSNFSWGKGVLVV